MEICVKCGSNNNSKLRLGMCNKCYLKSRYIPHPKQLLSRVCINCDSKTTAIYKGHVYWHKHPDKDGSLCNKCYEKLYRRNSPRYKKYQKEYDHKYYKNNKQHIDEINMRYYYENHEFFKEYNKRLLQIDNKRIRLNQNPRKGICEQCDMKIGDVFTKTTGEISILKKTFMHLGNNEYNPNNPLDGTMELCLSCHVKANWQEGVFINR